RGHDGVARRVLVARRDGVLQVDYGDVGPAAGQLGQQVRDAAAGHEHEAAHGERHAAPSLATRHFRVATSTSVPSWVTTTNREATTPSAPSSPPRGRTSSTSVSTCSVSPMRTGATNR